MTYAERIVQPTMGELRNEIAPRLDEIKSLTAFGADEILWLEGEMSMGIPITPQVIERLRTGALKLVRLLAGAIYVGQPVQARELAGAVYNSVLLAREELTLSAPGLHVGHCHRVTGSYGAVHEVPVYQDGALVGVISRAAGLGWKPRDIAWPGHVAGAWMPMEAANALVELTGVHR